MKVGKYGIPVNVRSHAHREGLGSIVFCSVAGCGFDAAGNFSVVPHGVSSENCKLVVRAFHGYAFSTVRFHHRRRDSHERVFPDGAARTDDESIVFFLQLPIF